MAVWEAWLLAHLLCPGQHFPSHSLEQAAGNSAGAKRHREARCLVWSHTAASGRARLVPGLCDSKLCAPSPAQERRKQGSVEPAESRMEVQAASLCFLSSGKDGLPWRLRWLRIHLHYGRPGLDPWVGRISWRRAWQPTPAFLPGRIPMDRGAWWPAVHGVTKSWTRPSLVAQTVKRLPTTRETRVRSLGRKDPLEKEMATHSSILAWKIPWMEGLGWLLSMGSPRVGHD